ncbi:MAG: glycosyltransferase [Nanoarchaeota archaeon]|nr:glycosyltransferase [Nanoarchaeota archaeon]
MREKVILLCPQPYVINRGTPLAILNIVHALIESGFAVDLVTTSIGDASKIEHCTVHRVKHPFSSLPPGFSIRKLILMPLLFAKAYSLMKHTTYSQIVSLEDGAFPGLILRKLFKTRHVYRMHCLPHESCAPGGVLSFILRGYEKIVFRGADVLVPITTREVSYLKERYPSVESFDMPVVPANRNEKADMGAVSSLRKKIGIENNDIVVLWIGNLAHYQGSEMLVSLITAVAASKHEIFSRIKFLIAGSDGDIRSLFDPSAYSNVITYSPEFSEMPSIVALGDIALSLRYLDNGFPSKVTVFLRAGKAILAVSTESHRCHLNAKNAMIVANDVDSLVAGVESLALDARKRHALGEGAQLYYASVFSWEQYVSKWKNALSVKES